MSGDVKKVLRHIREVLKLKPHLTDLARRLAIKERAAKKKKKKKKK